MSDDCLFCRIVRGEVPCRKVFESDEFLAFHDIHPQAPVHFLVVPRLHLAGLGDALTEEDRAMLGRLMALLPELATQQGLSDGFRTVINTGRGGGQEVFHLHVHVLGGGGSAR